MPILGVIASSIAKIGSFDSIATTTVGSGGQANIEFTSISSAYTHLQLRISVLSGATYSEITFNSDTAANYTYHQVIGDGSSATSAGAGSQSSIFAAQMAASTTHPTVAVIDILDYKNTNKFKTVRIMSGNDTNGGGAIYYRSGLWRSTNAISSLKIAAILGTASFAQNSIFALYGIKEA